MSENNEFTFENPQFRVVTRKGGKETDNSVLNYVKKHEDESGIIYCATKKNADKIYGLLQQYGIEAGHYHRPSSSLSGSGR